MEIHDSILLCAMFRMLLIFMVLPSATILSSSSKTSNFYNPIFAQPAAAATAAVSA
jgi:hypothetical protein